MAEISAIENTFFQLPIYLQEHRNMSNNKQKKIGPFDGYRSNAFFGFNIPKIPKITHFHLPIAQTK